MKTNQMLKLTHTKMGSWYERSFFLRLFSFNLGFILILFAKHTRANEFNIE